MTVQKIERDRSLPRVESGPLQFGDDWPGLFIRGDNSFGLMLAIQEVVDWVKSQSGWDQIFLSLSQLEGFAGDIDQGVIVKTQKPQDQQP